MPNVHFVLADGQMRTVDAKEGWSLMEVAREAGIPGIVAECGGNAMCSTCHVHVDKEWIGVVGPPDELEQITLDLAPDLTDDSRLSCQIKIRTEFEGLIVHIPRHQAGY
jgi:ferredoxin, 2Fe-2S